MLLIGAAGVAAVATCLPALARVQEILPLAGDVEVGTAIEVGPDVLCSLPLGTVDGVPQTKSAFPIDAFLNVEAVGDGLTATATRTKWGVEVIVHAPPEVVNTISAVRTLTAFTTRKLQPCPVPGRALPVNVGVENLDIITEDGVATDFNFEPKN